MTEDPPDVDPIAVLCVGTDADGLASALSGGRADFAVEGTDRHELPDRLSAGRPDAVVVDATGGDLAAIGTVREDAPGIAVVACVDDAAAGERALDRGATRVHRVDREAGGGPGDTGLLTRRIASAIEDVRRSGSEERAGTDATGTERGGGTRTPPREEAGDAGSAEGPAGERADGSGDRPDVPTEASPDGSTDHPRGVSPGDRALGRIEDGILSLDDEWVCTYANDRARALFDPDGAGLEGAVVWERLPDSQGRAFFNAAKRALEEGETVTVKERLDDGQWYELRMFPDESGVTTYVHDVTERKRRDERLGRLLMTTRALMAAESRDDVATTVASAVQKVLGYGYGRVYLVDGEGEGLDPVATTDDLGAGHFEAAFVRQAYERGSPVVEASVEGEGPVSALLLPLGDHGVLAVASDTTDAFAQSDIAVGEILTANAVAALDRADRRETLRRYEDVLETVQGMVYALDADGRFTLVTDQLAERLGYDRADIEGEHVSTILDDESLRRGESVVRNLLETDRESDTFETEMTTADGTRVPVEVNLSLLPGEGSFRGTVGAVRDRTELERTRAALETERDRFTYLFENLPDPVAELEYHDGEPIVQAVNRAFVETFGVEPDAIIGECLNDHVIPYSETADRAARLDERLAAGEFVTQELRRETGDGIGDFLLRGIPYRTEDEPTRVFGIYTDITEQKRRQRRLGVLNRVLRHNVRNEMTIIRGYSKMIADRLVGEGTDRDLAEAAVELAESAATIEELSTEARRVEKVLKEDHQGEIDVSGLVEEYVETIRSDHPDADLRLAADEEVVAATTDRIELAIEHLVENAIEHNDGDEPTVRVSTAEGPDDTAVVAVEDDGPGIPEYERGVVTGDREVTQLEHGSGLGLWIVKWTVEGFGGHVRFSESDLGGATVEIRLPQPDGDRDGTDSGDS